MTHGVNKYTYVKHKHQQKYIQLRLINELKQKMNISELRQFRKSYNSGWGGGERGRGQRQSPNYLLWPCKNERRPLTFHVSWHTHKSKERAHLLPIRDTIMYKAYGTTNLYSASFLQYNNTVRKHQTHPYLFKCLDPPHRRRMLFIQGEFAPNISVDLTLLDRSRNHLIFDASIDTDAYAW